MSRSTGPLPIYLGKPFDWATIYTYSTNATATLITDWVGAAISTSPNIPETIGGQPSVVNYNTVFRAKTALTNCTIGANVSFVDNTMKNVFYSCRNLIGVDAIPANVTNMASTFQSCSNLVNATTIGANVTSMKETFRSCSNLVGNITIVNANVTSFYDYFRDCNASLAKNLRCPAGSATATLAQSVCNGKNGVTVVNY